MALGPGDDPPPPIGDDGTTLYESDAVVLQSSEHGAELCIGAVADSFPPQCSGIPISMVTNAGPYPTATARRRRSIRGAVSRTGGRLDRDGPFTRDGRASPDGDAHGRARGRLRGYLVDYLVPPEMVDEGTVAPNDVLLVAAFTGDLVRHEAELREIWGGPLCVTRHNRTMKELERIQAEIASEVGDQLGIEKTWSSIDVTANEVEIGVVVADEDVRDALDERYGPGAVELHPALLRVQ